MTLQPGIHLGPYEIVAPLGAGGMGEVYKARDTRLDRTVAIKILPDALAADPQFRERFDREARAISQLTHPHICTLHDVGEHTGTAYLVMELLEGETLAARLEKGALPLDLALKTAIEIASALDKAHRAGIVHRDLKPGNIMLTKGGAKLLDFGLAKTSVVVQAFRPAVEGGSKDPRYTDSMLLTTPPPNLTAHGTILGTFQYMAPEQLEGAEADARTDIFAFGAVVYEMLTGKKAFEGKSQASLIGAILEREPPPITASQPLTPSSLDHVVRRCLAKDPDERWQSAGDLMRELKWAAAATPELSRAVPLVARRNGRELIAWSVAAVAALAALGVTARLFTEAVPEPPASVRFSLSAPPDTAFGNDSFAAVAPDGRRLAFTVTPLGGGRPRLAVRLLDADEARELPGTDGAAGAFWSPDSRFIGFFADGKLKKIDATGSPPQVVCDVALGGGNGSWSGDGTILFSATGASGLRRVPAGGGTPVPATMLDTAKKEFAHSSPWFLPDGRHFLYVAGSNESGGSSVYAGSLDDPARVLVAAAESKAIYVTGYVLYIRQGALLAQPFDADRLTATGDPMVVAQIVAGAAFSASSSGVLAYRTGNLASPTQLALVDRSGKPLGTIGAASDQTDLELSPDGSRVALSVLDLSQRTRDIWIHDLRRDVRTRLTFDKGDEWHSAWSPDGTRLVYGSWRRPGPLDLYQRAADGSDAEERLVAGSFMKYVSSWSADGRFILYWNGATGSPTGNDIWLLPLSGDRTPRAFLQTAFNEGDARFSPDGRWVAFRSSESGRNEVYVIPFPGPGGKWQVSTGGGTQPRWRRDGNELYYLTGGNTVMAAAVNGQGAAFDVGIVQRLFEAQLRTNTGSLGTGNVYDVSADGQRFLINRIVDDPGETPIRVVTNWTSLLSH